MTTSEGNTVTTSPEITAIPGHSSKKFLLLRRILVILVLATAYPLMHAIFSLLIPAPISPPFQPRVIGQIVGKIADDAVLSVQRIQIVGSYAYLAAFMQGNPEFGGGGLSIVDVKDPAHPRIVVTLLDDGLVGVRDMKIVGKFAYFTGDKAGLTVVDISDPEKPFVVATTRYGGQRSPNAINVRGNYAFIGDRSGLFAVFDITEPTRPIPGPVINNDSDFDQAKTISLAGNHAYIGGPNGKVTVVDVSDPMNPARLHVVGYIGLGKVGQAMSIEALGDTLFIADHDHDALLIEHLDTATNTTTIGRVDGIKAFEVHVRRPMAYVISYPGSSNESGVSILNITDPARPKLNKTFLTEGQLPFTMAVDGQYAYVSYYNEFDIVDLR